MPVASIDDQIPEGFELRHTFHIPEKINRIAWSPDGQTIALPSRSEAIQLWDVNTEVLLHTFKGNFNYCVAWSPDGQTLASGGVFRLSLWDTKSRELRWRHRTSIKSTKSLAWSPDGQLLALAFASDSSDGIGSSDGIIEIWNVETQQLLRTLTGHTDDVNSVEWSPNGKILASGSNDNTVRLWDIETGELIHTFVEHFNDVNSVTWSSNGKKLASASSDNTVRLWDVETKRQNGILEGHVKSVISVSFSYDARLLASKSLDGTVRLWRLDNLDVVTVLLESSLPHGWYGGLAFHPKRYMLATLGEMDEAIRIWKLNLTTLLGDSPALYSFHYKNAKVILVGDSGVGKSGLSLVLTNQPFVPTESTHSRHVWQFDIQKEELDNEHIETHETFLWDLAGQPGYRLTHQLYLNEVAVALIVFDARSETDPFAGVYHWERVLRLIEQIQKNPLSSMKRFLVAARVDRGGISVSQKRIDSLKNELKFNDYFETSAKEDQGIVEIIESIKKRINWDIPPKVSSFDLFQNIKKFIATMRETGLLLCTIDSLYSSFLVSKPASEGIEDLRDQFNNCIKHLEAGGLIQELKFGNFVLLKPELLDSYAAALVNSVKDEPDGLGSILEEKALTGTFTMPEDERLQEKEQEKLLLIAMVKHLLHYEIALREVTDDGVYLVFPSQSTREYPTSSNLGKKALIFNFEGPVLNIYSTLVVRLSHSGIFTKKELWKDVVTFTYRYPDSNQDLGTCGILLRNFGEGSGELTIYFDMRSNAEMRFHLENYVNRHLQSQALVESFKRRDVFVCERCGFEVPDELVHVMLGSYFSL